MWECLYEWGNIEFYSKRIYINIWKNDEKFASKSETKNKKIKIYSMKTWNEKKKSLVFVFLIRKKEIKEIKK